MYEVTKELVVCNNKVYCTYGIKYNDKYFIKDISPQWELIHHAVDQFNHFEISPIHLYDIVNDLILT